MWPILQWTIPPFARKRKLSATPRENESSHDRWGVCERTSDEISHLTRKEDKTERNGKAKPSEHPVMLSDIVWKNTEGRDNLTGYNPL